MFSALLMWPKILLYLWFMISPDNIFIRTPSSPLISIGVVLVYGLEQYALYLVEKYNKQKYVSDEKTFELLEQVQVQVQVQEIPPADK